MDIHTLKNLLCLSENEKQYLTDTFKNSDNTHIQKVDAEPFLDKQRLIAVRINDTFSEMSLHQHNYIEMIWLYRGDVTHHINDTQLNMQSGDLLLMNQFTHHTERKLSKEDIEIIFIIRPEFFNIPLKMMQGENDIKSFLINSFRENSTAPQYLFFHTTGQPNVKNLLENLVYASCQETEKNTICQYTTGLLFLQLLEHTQDIIRSFSHNERDIIIRETLNYIDSSYNSVTLNQIADEFHHSPSRMSKIIKEGTGFTFQQLLIKKRFQKALQLLLETNLQIEAIAIHVGYENLSYFYRTFKKLYGMTPRQYRKLHETQSYSL